MTESRTKPFTGLDPHSKIKNPKSKISKLRILVRAPPRLLHRILRGILRQLGLDRLGQVDAADVGKLERVDYHVGELVLDLLALLRIRQHRGGIARLGPQEM